MWENHKHTPKLFRVMAVSLWLSCTHDIILVYFFTIYATISFEVVRSELFSTEVQIFLFYLLY